MAMKRLESESHEEDQEQFDASSYDAAAEHYDALDSEASDDIASDIQLTSEPMFSALLRRVVHQLWGDDPVLHDFVTHVAPRLSDLLGHVAAKGGDFVLEKRATGVDVSRYAGDQSQRGHLVNGLFPVLHVAYTLQRWRAPQFRYYDDTVRRVFIAGYVLHDWLKLPDVQTELETAGLRHDSVNAAQHREIVEAIFKEWCERLELGTFLAPVGGVDLLLYDLIYVACNTQIKWGTLRNLAALPRLHLPGPQRDLAEQLSRLADYLAYVGRNPRQVVADLSIHREISTLSNQMARLVYHHVSDVRGVITNLIHNAALEALSSDDCVPLLYAPSGVVYLARKEAGTWPKIAELADNIVHRVKSIAGRRLYNTLIGFSRDGKGLKYADYYTLFFETLRMLDVGIRATFKLIHPGKRPSSGRRYAKIADNGWLAPDVDLALPDDIRVDQMAEWCYLAENVLKELPGGEHAPRILLDALGLGDLYQDFLAVPRDNRAGGVGYHWYFAAGHHLKRNPGLDPADWQKRIEELATTLKTHFAEQQLAAVVPEDDGFSDLRQYVAQVLTFGPSDRAGEAVRDGVSGQLFAAEFERYTKAKKRGWGTTAMCSLCSSPYTVSKQEETAILFAPQVYSNKMVLHSTSAIRDICSICSLEMMLRQLLMNRSNASGRHFEGRRMRYLYFYPSYFFTPETLELFRILHSRLRRISFTELRKQLVKDGEVHLSPTIWQRLEPLLLTPEEEFNPEEDRYLRMHFPENEPITFYFLGVPPPGRDSKDAEAWVHPAFLALLLPLCVDVKVVASESQMPLMGEADELPETVFLDGAHAAIGYITHNERINLDKLWPTLNRLAVSYLIHLDGNSSVGAGGFDYRWQDLPGLARRLAETPLHTFAYLKKWQRNARSDAIPTSRAQLYLTFYHYLTNGGDNEMTHARKLTDLYRRFYRTRSGKTHAIVRPISIVAEAVLEADPLCFDSPEALEEVAHGRLFTRVRQLFRENLAYPPQGSTREEQEKAMAEFARYFVCEVFYGAFRGNKAALAGKQLNLLKNACEVLYRTAEAQYWAERRKASEDDTAAEGPFEDDDIDI